MSLNRNPRGKDNQWKREYAQRYEVWLKGVRLPLV